MDVTHPWLEDLTPPQRRAVTHDRGPLLVLAGPGSGKTRVITRRICHRIACGVAPWQILALTFTNKAAREMRSRIDALASGGGRQPRGLVMGTFHAFSAGLLRQHAEHSAAAGVAGHPLKPDFTILDSDDARRALKQAITEVGLAKEQWRPGYFAEGISKAKDRLHTSSEFASEANEFADRQCARVYAAYERILAKQNALDFDDLLLRTARMLRDDESVRTRLQERFAEVLVDEYQDTNNAQLTIANAIACAHRQICVVGDPDQSIYGWRGADISNILEFEERYPGATVVPLGENFRSTGHIVATADALIRRNGSRRHKDLTTSLGMGEMPVISSLYDELEEASHVAGCLEASRDAGVAWKQMAVLYRANALSRTIEDALRRRGIPHVIARGTAFYERREVRDTLAYLRAIANPADDLALSRIVNVPARGIGATSMERLESFASARMCSLSEALVACREVGITAKAAKSVDGLMAVIARFRSELEVKPASNLGPFVARLVEEAHLERAAADYGDDPTDAEERVANVQEVVNAATLFALPTREDGAREPTLGDALRGYLEAATLVADADMVDPERGSVTLMTLHASKGLEFDTVVIVGLEEGILPHSRSIESGEGIEEERRLLFVGITRCERRLHLTSAQNRTMRGLTMPTIRSSFLRELPHEHCFSGEARRTVEYDEELPQYPVGSTVRSPFFGLGRVEGVGSRGAVTIRFVTAGVRTLYPKFAKLEIVATR